MLHLEREAYLHNQRLHEAADHARLVAEARGPRERRSLFNLLPLRALIQRRSAQARTHQPAPMRPRVARPDAV